jgi:hypothetical protein
MEITEPRTIFSTLCAHCLAAGVAKDIGSNTSEAHAFGGMKRHTTVRHPGQIPAAEVPTWWHSRSEA